MDGLREKAADYHALLWRGEIDAAASFLAPGYIEHQHSAGFSLAGLQHYVRDRRARHPDHRIIQHHILSEDPLVFLMAEEKLGQGVDYACAEMFRFDAQQRIAEHWSAHVLDDKNRRNNRGTFDGSRVDRGRDYARQHGETFEALDDRAFNHHDLAAFHISRVPDYIQHSPKGRDGLGGLIEILSAAKDKGLRFSARRLHTLADGDFLVSHRLYDCDPPTPLLNHHTFDIFRLDSAGRAVEHWDVMDPISDRALIPKLL